MKMAKSNYTLAILLIAASLSGCNDNHAAERASDARLAEPAAQTQIINRPQLPLTDNHGWGSVYDEVDLTTGIRIKYIESNYPHKNAFTDTNGNPYSFAEHMSAIYIDVVTCTGLPLVAGPFMVIGEFPFEVDGAVVYQHMYADGLIITSDLGGLRYSFIDYLLQANGFAINRSDPYQIQLQKDCN